MRGGSAWGTVEKPKDIGFATPTLQERRSGRTRLATSGREPVHSDLAHLPDTIMRKSTFQKIEALLGRLAPEPICDNCILNKLALTDIGDVAMNTTELAGMDQFERTSRKCSMCGDRQKVTRHV